jgi:hypothetical protein
MDYIDPQEHSVVLSQSLTACGSTHCLTNKTGERIRKLGNGGAGIPAERRPCLDPWNLIRVIPAKEIAARLKQSR